MMRTMSISVDSDTRDLLDAITSRLQRGESAEALMAQSEDTQSELDDVLELVQSLHASLTPLNPSPEFADGLGAELRNGSPGEAGRLRRVPARLSVAAILAVFAGCILFMLRRIFGSDPAADIQEEAVATPL